MNLQKLVEKTIKLGYSSQDARLKVCQDVVLKAIALSPLANNVTIKGGIVMRSITGNVRRATQDMDIDFIKYSMSDDSINNFIKTINCIPNVSISLIGKIIELKHQDYQGKKVIIEIKDSYDFVLSSSIDFGVHNHLDIYQEEYCFDVCLQDSISLLINSKEQIFTEKLLSLLKHGSFNTRYKDIFDMYYLCDILDPNTLMQNINILIFNDNSLPVNNYNDIIHILSHIFSNKTYLAKLENSDKRWIDEDVDIILNKIVEYINSLK